MNKNKSNLLIGVILVAIFIIGIATGYGISQTKGVLSEIISKSDESITFIVSIIALIISMVTFFSIDAVDKKNRMDNNVLEMEKYNASYHSMIRELNVTDKETFQRILLEKVIDTPKIHSCMEFADWVQRIIDHIIWFAYFDWDQNQGIKEKLINDLRKEYEHYNEIGSGIKVILDENIKLIEQVLTYQEYRKKDENVLSSIEEVRGTVLVNPISKMIFHNYLGLDYRKYAGMMMKQGTHEEFTKEYFKEWKEKQNIFDENKCRFLVQTAKDNFSKAEEIAKDDFLWRGYLKYNVLRTEIMLFLLSDQEERKISLASIKIYLDECVTVRENICFMFQQDGYLKERFENEKLLAETLRDNFNAVF